MLAELRSVTKFYDQQGSREVNLILDNVSLEISDKDSIAIVGPSGSGKSTLLNMLSTLDHPFSGHVLLDNMNIEAYTPDQLAALRSHFLGLIFQEHHLLPQLTMLENVLLPVLPLGKNEMESAQGRALELIEAMDLSGLIHQYPGNMSVGERQRVAVARALINKPRLLLADEPTGALDSDNASRLADLLSEVHENLKVGLVVVTHSMVLASRMKKIFLLNHGHLIEQTA